MPIGKELMDTLNYEFKGPPESYRKNGQGSIIVVLGTDAPLLPHQLKRIAERISIGIGNVGGRGENSSGDIFFVFSTANEKAFNRDAVTNVQMLPNEMMDPLFDATVQATEEAIINAMVAAETMEGINGNKAYGLPAKKVVEILKKYNRLPVESVAKKEMVLPAEMLKLYTGSYELGPNVNIVVSQENGKLFIQPPGQGKVEMFAESPELFFLKVANVQFRFRKNEKGQINELVIMQGGMEQVARKIR